MDGFIFVVTNFHGLNENDTFVRFKIRGHSIFLHNSYRKLLIRFVCRTVIPSGLKSAFRYMDQGVSEGTCSQVLRSTSVDL